ncbi:hypothetical protein DPEC_G00229110 [Dallia pectoralis]|uniref:Uncharacterized protein n=1 Tax=Dallia pectoralis TaxID=75939 RepID=A0ACC2G146_DALPE|nr:hypothetical protein DPEC_G00229110 [Dallia pectoralis]
MLPEAVEPECLYVSHWAQRKLRVGRMSQEDAQSVRSSGSTGVDSESEHGDPQTTVQDREPDHDGDPQSPAEDQVVLDRIASLSVDMFEPSDFMGRFTKIKSKSRKKTKIFTGWFKQMPCL